MTYEMVEPDAIIKMLEHFANMDKEDLISTVLLNCCVVGTLQLNGILEPKEYDRLSAKCAKAIEHAMFRKKWKELS